MANESKHALRLAAAQFDAVSGDPDHNIARHIELLEAAAAERAALALFPELSVTGYCADLLDLDPAACTVEPEGGRNPRQPADAAGPRLTPRRPESPPRGGFWRQD